MCKNSFYELDLILSINALTDEINLAHKNKNDMIMQCTNITQKVK